MIKEVQLRVSPEQVQDKDFIHELVCRELHITGMEINHIEIVKRSIDARKKAIKFNLKLAVYINETFQERTQYFNPKDVHAAPEVHIIGAGPAGLFAALNAIEKGLKPIVYERGKDVRSRRRDLAKIHKKHIVDADSNYCFGEGGAGTYSDGKLYTRSKKRGAVKTVLEWLVHFGADKDILVDAHPHIGTNKLPKIITSIREEIIRCGGEVNFGSFLSDLKIAEQKVIEICVNENWIPVNHLILATGHSARDIFYLLHEKGVKIEAKPFALGVRVEHPQGLIDKIQYHGQLSDEILPPASYSLVEQVDGMGVYSFCMCPGGIVAPCATSQNEVVTNGWSPSKRNNPYANSGIVVQIHPEHLSDQSEDDPFICLKFQQKVEQDCWAAAGKTQAVPAQRLVDFIEGKKSTNLPESSYQPGLVSVDLNEVLPPMIAKRLKKAFIAFGKKMDGFMTNTAVIHAPESRTSSPVKIPRDKDSYEHTEIKALFPCGEGAGYAGGIVSAAVDGINIVEQISENISNR